MNLNLFFQHSFFKAICGILLYAMLYAMLCAANAEDEGSVQPVSPNSIGMYGFLTQGHLLSNHNNYFGESSSGGSFDFREIGLGATGQLTDKLRVSGLLLSRVAGKTDTGRLRADHLIADYSLLHTENDNYGVTAGRFKLQFGLYNDTRDVAATRPSILLPQSFYYDNARKFLSTADGVRFYNEHYDDADVRRISLDIGRTTFINNPETRVFLLGSRSFKGALKNDISYAARIHESLDGGKTQFVAVLSNQRVDYVPASPDILPAGNIHLTTLWLSAQQEIGKWTFTSEVFMPQAVFRKFGPIIKDKTSYPLGYYVQATHNSSASWEEFVRYDVAYTSKHDRDGRKLAASTGRPAHAFYAKDFTAGARYHMNKSIDISGEVHFIRGTAWLPIADNPTDSQTVRDWRLFALQFTYHF